MQQRCFRRWLMITAAGEVAGRSHEAEDDDDGFSVAAARPTEDPRRRDSREAHHRLEAGAGEVPAEDADPREGAATPRRSRGGDGRRKDQVGRRVRAVGANVHGEGDAGANGCDTESCRLHSLSVEGARADRGDGGAGGISKEPDGPEPEASPSGMTPAWKLPRPVSQGVIIPQTRFGGCGLPPERSRAFRGYRRHYNHSSNASAS